MKVVEIIQRAVTRADIEYRRATTVYNMVGGNRDDVTRTAGAYYALSSLLAEVRTIKEEP